MLSRRLDSQARQRALTRLAQHYPGIFRRLLDQERDKLGLPPVGELKRGKKGRDVGEE